MRARKENIFTTLISLVIILLLWQLLAWGVSWVRGIEFPSPLRTFEVFFKSLTGKPVYEYTIFQHAFASLSRWLIAYVMAVIIGIIAGSILGIYDKLNKLFMPLVTVLQLIPGLAWIPIALLLFGLGNSATIFMIFIIALTPIIITTATGIKNTPSNLVHAARIMGAGKKDLFTHVLFPSALFHIIDGMRIGLANSWRVLIAAEMIVGSSLGLGYIIIQSRWTLDYISAFVSIIVIVLIGLTAERFIFKRIENNLRKKYGNHQIEYSFSSE
jgi:ABC-type nitrate/sulfonate/bicarbonate transport system permease component